MNNKDNWVIVYNGLSILSVLAWFMAIFGCVIENKPSLLFRSAVNGILMCVGSVFGNLYLAIPAWFLMITFGFWSMKERDKTK